MPAKPRTAGKDWVSGYRAALNDVAKIICVRLALDQPPLALSNVLADLRNDAAVILHEIESAAQRERMRAGVPFK